MSNTVTRFYCHIDNGGVSFSVLNDDKYGATLEVSASHFGLRTNHMQLRTTSDTLAKLGQALLDASKYTFSGKPYCNALEVREDMSECWPNCPKEG